MKKIRFVNGTSVAYIHKDDLATLLSIKDSVNPVLFREKSIINHECDFEGYYKIEGKEAVSYIENLAYIPDYDSLNEIDLDVLVLAADKAVKDRQKLREILDSLCDKKKPYTKADRIALHSIDGIDQATAETIEQNALESSLDSVKFREMAHVLNEQLRNYTSALVKMADIREQEREQEDKPYSKRKHFINAIMTHKHNSNDTTPKR
jgi:hypothetical protein